MQNIVAKCRLDDSERYYELLINTLKERRDEVLSEIEKIKYKKGLQEEVDDYTIGFLDEVEKEIRILDAVLGL